MGKLMAEEQTVALDTRPICPFCNVGRLSTLVVLIICAYCQKAWQPFEFEIDLRHRDTEIAEAEGRP